MDTELSARWEDACAAATILAVDPIGIGGIRLRSAAGPVRDSWMAFCRDKCFPVASHWHRIPLNVSDDRLLGGLDLAATLQAGRPIAESGILASADGGIVTLSMAERLTAGTAAKIGDVLDNHVVVLERDGFARRVQSRFAVIALDEGIEPDERPPGALLDRLGLHVDLNGLPLAVTATAGDPGHDVSLARSRLSDVRASDEMLRVICETGRELGVNSARIALFVLRVARVVAALHDHNEVGEDDLTFAARLVLAPRALSVEARAANEDSSGADNMPADDPAQEQGPPHDDSQAQSEAAAGQSAQDSPDESAQRPAGCLADRVLEAVKAALPTDLLNQLRPSVTRSASERHSGRNGTQFRSQSRGRPTGTRAGRPGSGARVSVIETLRAAAPWQRIRRLAGERQAAGISVAAALTAKARCKAPLIRVKKDDIRLVRFIRHSRSTTIFVVDASGSAALHRLAEVKGAVELLLAESYVRRDRVALISFRGSSARLLLPPTNSLVRAKRELAGLPGGGGTPLATGIDAARALADSLKRRGETSMVVVLTDGGPNIGRDGKGGRVRAEADAVSAARMMRVNSITAMMVDTAPQPRQSTAHFAREMGARYVPLPFADAGSLASIVYQSGVGDTSALHRDRHV